MTCGARPCDACSPTDAIVVPQAVSSPMRLRNGVLNSCLGLCPGAWDVLDAPLTPMADLSEGDLIDVAALAAAVAGDLLAPALRRAGDPNALLSPAPGPPAPPASLLVDAPSPAPGANARGEAAPTLCPARVRSRRTRVGVSRGMGREVRAVRRGVPVPVSCGAVVDPSTVSLGRVLGAGPSCRAVRMADVAPTPPPIAGLPLRRTPRRSFLLTAASSACCPSLACTCPIS